VSKRARIRLSVGKTDKDPLHVDLRYRAFVHRRHPRLDIACSVEGQEVAAWSSTVASPSGTRCLTIPAGIIPADGAIDREFSVFAPRSPAELGASSDERLLGIGIETLSFR